MPPSRTPDTTAPPTPFQATFAASCANAEPAPELVPPRPPRPDSRAQDGSRANVPQDGEAVVGPRQDQPRVRRVRIQHVRLSGLGCGNPGWQGAGRVGMGRVRVWRQNAGQRFQGQVAGGLLPARAAATGAAGLPTLPSPPVPDQTAPAIAGAPPSRTARPHGPGFQAQPHILPVTLKCNSVSSSPARCARTPGRNAASGCAPALRCASPTRACYGL